MMRRVPGFRVTGFRVPDPESRVPGFTSSESRIFRVSGFPGSGIDDDDGMWFYPLYMTHPTQPPILLENVTFETAVWELSSERSFFCIDSRNAANPAGRYSVMGYSPQNSFNLTGGFITIDGHTSIDTPISALSKFTKLAGQAPKDRSIPFSGGLFGYVGFEGAKALRGFAPPNGFSRFPQCYFGLFGMIAIFDNIEKISFILHDDEHRAKAYLLKERLEGARPHAPNRWRWNENAAMCRKLPSQKEFRQLSETAFMWLRSDAARCIHLVQHNEQSIGEASTAEIFLNHASCGEISAIFTHEGAAAIISSKTPISRIDGAPHLDHAGEMAWLLPAKHLTGAPYHKVMSYIDENESLHRGFYGGAFGTITSDGMMLYASEKVTTIVDGNIRKTSGIDLTADMHPNMIVKY